MLQLELDPQTGERTAIVHCSGRIVFHDEARVLGDTVRGLFDRYERVVLDLSQVKDVDSAGLGAFASLHQMAHDKNRSFALLNPGSFVRDLLELTHLDRQLQVVPGGRTAVGCAA